LSAAAGYQVTPDADVTSKQAWLDENVFRKGVFELINEAAEPITLANLMPLFVARCTTYRGKDGGKSQAGYRVKELLEVGLIRVAPASQEVTA
jgi:hypothetical protein